MADRFYSPVRKVGREGWKNPKRINNRLEGIYYSGLEKMEPLKSTILT